MPRARPQAQAGLIVLMLPLPRQQVILLAGQQQVQWAPVRFAEIPSPFRPKLVDFSFVEANQNICKVAGIKADDNGSTVSVKTPAFLLQSLGLPVRC